MPRVVFSLISLVVMLVAAPAAEVIPPAPRDHFNDYAGMVRRETAAQLNAQLAQFERDTSSQIVVALFPRMPSASSVEDYTVRVAQSWGVGQRERRNGAVLFVFQETHDVRIVTGYGVEGALPDALCKQIIENEIIPRFRAGDFDGGISAGVRAMMAAVRGEYQGTGRTARDAKGTSGGRGGNFVFLIIVVIMIMIMSRASRRNVVYGRRGRNVMWGGGPWGGWGGGSSGGGGTFSGGGGSFGGGGAGGRW